MPLCREQLQLLLSQSISSCARYWRVNAKAAVIAIVALDCINVISVSCYCYCSTNWTSGDCWCNAYYTVLLPLAARISTLTLCATTITLTSGTAQMSAKFYEQLAHLEQYEKWPQDILYGELDMPQSRSQAGKRKRSSSSKKVPTATANKRGRYYSSHVSMHPIQDIYMLSTGCAYMFCACTRSLLLCTYIRHCICIIMAM
jgi:hypothetical protein